MSNRELLERCLKVIEQNPVDQLRYVDGDFVKTIEKERLVLITNLKAELSKPSQNEEFNLAEYWKREHDELKAKLVEAKKDAMGIIEAEEIIFNSGMAFEPALDHLDCPVAHLQGCYGIRELKALIVKFYSYESNNIKELG